MTRQYLHVRFWPDQITYYWYHNDGQPKRVGDRARVRTRHGERQVDVMFISITPPGISTKPIVDDLTAPPFEGPLLPHDSFTMTMDEALALED